MRIGHAVPFVLPCLLAAQSPQVPAHFVANQGQWHADAAFRTRSGATTAWFTRTGWALSHVEAIPAEPRRPAPDSAGLDAIDHYAGASVRMTFEGAVAREVRGEARLPGVHHYLLGDDPSGWVRDVPGFARLRYGELLPGIDVVVRSGRGIFAYDVYVAASADVADLVLRCEGVDSVELAEDGQLVMATALGVIRQSAPIAWHVSPSGERQAAACGFRLLGEHRFGFAVGARPPGCALVIDPDLTWMTYLGGIGSDHPTGVVVDENGLVTAAGRSLSVNYPVSAGSYQLQAGGFWDAVVTRLDPSQSGPAQLVWSTCLGGAADDVAFEIALGPAGGATVAGLTTSPGFPTTTGAYQPAIRGGLDGFVATIGPSGGTLFASTFLGGPRDDFVNGLAVDPVTFEVTVSGYTMSASFPTTPSAYQPSFGGGLSDAFVSRFDLSLTNLLASTFLGGSGNEFHTFVGWFNGLGDMDRGGLVVDGAKAIATGGTYSSDFPTTPGAYQTTNANTNSDVWVGVLDLSAAGNAQLVYGTYIGGTAYETGKDVAYEPRSGLIAVGGYTYSSSYPSTSGAYQQTFVGPSGNNDAYVSFLDPTQSGASQLLYSTFLGATSYESVMGLAMDARGVATAVGFTRASGFPVTAGAFQTIFAGPGATPDAFLARIDPRKAGYGSLFYSTFLGGTSQDGLDELALDGSGGAYVVGGTAGSAFPYVTPGAFQPSFGGGTYEGIVGHLNLLPRLLNSTFAIDRDRSCLTPGPDGHVILEVSRQPMLSFDFLIGNAPPNAFGAIAFGFPAPCATILGANIGLTPIASVLIQSDAFGSATYPFLYSGQAGFRVQTAWLTGTSPPLCSSANLDF